MQSSSEIYTTQKRKCDSGLTKQKLTSSSGQTTDKTIQVCRGFQRKTKIPEESIPSTAPRAASVLPAAAVPLAWLAGALPQGSVAGLKV